MRAAAQAALDAAIARTQLQVDGSGVADGVQAAGSSASGAPGAVRAGQLRPGTDVRSGQPGVA